MIEDPDMIAIALVDVSNFARATPIKLGARLLPRVRVVLVGRYTTVPLRIMETRVEVYRGRQTLLLKRVDITTYRLSRVFKVRDMHNEHFHFRFSIVI